MTDVAPRRPRLPATVWALAWVSFFTDLSSEMIVPLLPVFLAGLGGSMVALGLLQGTSEVVVAALKLLSGWLSDKQVTKKPWIVFGYGLSTLLRPLFALVQTPLQAVLVRGGDRLGKGLRSAPRDALLANVVDGRHRGAAFGVQRAMDHAGALGGALVASALLWGGCELRTVFALALLPGLVAVFVVVVGVHEGRTAALPGDADDPPGALRRLLPFLLVVVFSAVAGSVDLFVLARASELGVPVVQLPLLWAVLHVVRAGLSQPLGALSDRLGQRRVIGCGLFVHALVMLGFAHAGAQGWMWPLFAVHGLHAAFTEGAERGYLAALSGAPKRGRVFGVYHAVQGLSAFAGPVGLGLLWDEGGAWPAFVAAAAASVVALLLLIGLVPAARGPRRG